MSRGRFLRVTFIFLITAVSLSAALFLRPQSADAGIYDANSDLVYTEYWVEHANNYSGLCDNTGLNNGFIQTFIEPAAGVDGCTKTLDFDMPALSGQNTVEIYIDLWRNHDTPSAEYQINDSTPIQTDVGSDWSRTPYFHTIPNNVFDVGSNQITFVDTAGQYHVKDVAFRVYGPASANTPSGGLVGIEADNGWFDPTGSITEALQIDSDQLVLSATASANTDYIEFHAYYDGYDEDNDGVFTDWHNKGQNNLHPGGMSESPTGGTIDHIGTVPVSGAGTYAITWDMPHIISQSGVRFKVRLVNQEGNVNYVRDAAGGDSTAVTLERNTPSVYFINPSFEDIPLNMDGEYPLNATVNVDLPPDISDFDTAYLIGSYWNNPKISINGGSNYDAFPDASPFPAGEWFLSILEIDINDLQGGTNAIQYASREVYGEFIEKPGPMIVLKRNAPLGIDDAPPYVYNQSPEDNAALVEPDTNVSATVFDAGGIDLNSGITMTVKIGNGAFTPVTPVISGNQYNADLFYNPPTDFPFSTVITARVEVCDLSDNCTTSTWSFTTRQELLPSSITSDDFNACALDDGPGGLWTFVGDGTVSQDGERVLITAPAGSVHNLWTNGDNNAPRIMQGANNQDFDIQVKFDSTVSELIESQGIVVQDANSGKFLRFEYQAGNLGRTFLYIYAIDGASVMTVPSSGSLRIVGAEYDKPSYLRVVRTGLLDWTLFYATDLDLDGNPIWKSGLTLNNYSMNVDQVGAYVINWASPAANAPEHTAVIDYFFNTASPIDPEDNTPLILETTAAGLGSGVINKSSECGNPVTVSAVADPGSTFDHWSGVTSIEGSDNPSPGAITFGLDDTLVAHFTRDEYTLNIDVVSVDHEGNSTSSTAGGNVTTSQDFPYYYDDEVTLTAHPEPGWTFTGWQGAGLSGTQLSKTITMQQSENVTATFTQDKYNLTVTQPAHGNIIVGLPTDSRSYLLYGEEVTLEAQQTEADWQFAGWGGDLAGSTQNPITVAMTGDLNVTATFADQFYIYLPMVIRP